MAQAHADPHPLQNPGANPDKYYVPHSSPLPVFGSVTLFVMMLGAALTLEQTGVGPWILAVGLGLLFVLFYAWFSKVVAESEGGMYNLHVDRSFRMGMMWFIFSEVMFFAAFFGALFYARQLALPWLSGEGARHATNVVLWSNFEGGWPSNGPAALSPRPDGSFETIPAIGLPLINTLILLASGVTITIAHHALRAGNRARLSIFLAATFILGFIFVGVQSYEYVHAWRDLGLQMGTGIYGSTFFMLTGFHGLHVTIGAIMLLVIWLRVLKGHFTPQRHFGFEATAWYWHFVDVVWLGLFIFVYWL